MSGNDWTLWNANNSCFLCVEAVYGRRRTLDESTCWWNRCQSLCRRSDSSCVWASSTPTNKEAHRLCLDTTDRNGNRNDVWIWQNIYKRTPAHLLGGFALEASNTHWQKFLRIISATWGRQTHKQTHKLMQRRYGVTLTRTHGGWTSSCSYFNLLLWWKWVRMKLDDTRPSQLLRLARDEDAESVGDPGQLGWNLWGHTAHMTQCEIRLFHCCGTYRGLKTRRLVSTCTPMKAHETLKTLPLSFFFFYFLRLWYGHF